MQHYRLGEVLLERNLGLLVTSQLTRSQVAQEVQWHLACISNRVANQDQSSDCHPYSTLLRPHLEYCVPHFKKDTGVLKCIQRRAARVMEGLERVL